MVLPETTKLVFFARRAHSGKKKRTLIRAVMNPPAYPGTRSRGPVPPPLVEETSHLALDISGRLAPRWLQDFIVGELDDGEPVVQDVGCASADFRRDSARRHGGNYPDSATPPTLRHELLLKGHQSFQGEGASAEPPRRADGKECSEVLACVCQNCRHHFTFYIDRKSNASCGLARNNHKDPFHHLVHLLNDTIAPKSTNAKFYPYHGQCSYICSAKHCGFTLSVEVSRPRLSDHFLSFLNDNDRIRDRLKLAMETEPERFADVANVTPNALAYLRAYLRDIVEGRSEKNADGTEVERKIDQRNKKFYIQFGNGPDAAELLTYLGFEEIVDEDSRYWKVPSPVITRPTRPGSQLAFYQDIKSEVETIIGKDSQNMKPNAAISFITNALDIGDYAVSEEAYNEYQVADYERLGLVPRMHESYFWYAYTCQRQTLPGCEEEFFRCLQRLARGRNNEELELRVQSFDSMRTDQPEKPRQVDTEEDQIRLATELSLQDVQLPTGPRQMSSDDRVEQAYNYFGLREGQRSDDEVLGKYISTAESLPSQMSPYREKLLLIARHTNSKILQERAIENMSLEESVKYLSVASDTENSYIINYAQMTSNNGERDYAVAAQALRTIAAARNYDPVLLSAAQDILVHYDQNYESSALPYDRMDLDGRNQVVNLALPVGLDNIRNTCYLNSILQYLYTVKPIHEIVANIDQFGLQDTEASLQNRRIDPGSTHLEKGEAYAGQQFVEQLSSLFQELQECQSSSLRPPQRLAIAALKNSTDLETDGSKLLAKEQDHSLSFDLSNPNRTESSAPPLPARHTPVPSVPSTSPQNTTVLTNPLPSLRPATTNPTSEADNADSSSTRSSQTLVNQGENQGKGQRETQGQEGWQNIPQVNVSMEEVPAEDGVMDDVPMAVHVEQAENKDLPPLYEAAVGGDGGDTSMDDVPAPAAAGSHIQETTSGGVQIVFDPPPVAEQTVKQKIDRALNDSSVTGTDQQDVEEVMGNIISHLRAAVKATGEDPDTGAQRDPVTDTFFWKSATYSRSSRSGSYNRLVAPNRWVTAFPDEESKISLLQALNSSFQREFITQGTTWYERFTSIVELPPILHVHIQRSKGNGAKIKTPITIPQTLHLDQFMDSLEGSDLFARRRHAWNLQERIRSLKGPNGETSELNFPPSAIGKASGYTDNLVKDHIRQWKSRSGKSKEPKTGPATGEGSQTTAACTTTNTEVGGDYDNVDDILDIDFDDDIEGGSDDDGYIMINDAIQAVMKANGISASSTKPLGPKIEESVDKDVDEKHGTSEANRRFLDEARHMSPEEIEQYWAQQDLIDAGNEMMRVLADKKASYEEELSSLFDDLRAPEHEYRLHAVVCHSGSTGSAGHYWVWVYDFGRHLWRQYNDSLVKEEPDMDKVMQQLSNQGEPYYLAYVRASDVERMVGVPLRQEPSSPLPPPPMMPPPPPMTTQGSMLPPPPPRPHTKTLPVISEVDVPPISSTPISTSTSFATDNSSSLPANLFPPPPPSHPASQLLTTPPLEEEEPFTPPVGGLDGQDASKLPPPPPLPPLPTPELTPAPIDDGQTQ